MELENIHNIYFIGIGGIGMSALARYFNHCGIAVFGYDKTKTPLTEALSAEGIAITYLDALNEIPAVFDHVQSSSLVVYTPAIPKSTALYMEFIKRGFQLKKRSELLGIISAGTFCIAIAGTHGKTTTSALTAHILTHTGYGCTAFLGGIAANYQSNVLFGDAQTLVVEADEFDRSFLTLHPDIAVITSMDADHLDIYHEKSQLEESFQLFANQIAEDGQLFHKSNLPLSKGISYDALKQDASIHAEQIHIKEGQFVFDYCHDAFTIKEIGMPLPGIHNIENALAAIAIARSLGIEPQRIKKAIADFKGVQRRFETIIKTAQHIYIDDYAHHPEELKACFNAVRMLYPNKKLTVLFQPHLFSRTRDFADEFAEVLSTVDDLWLLAIYPARELPIEGIDSNYLFEKISLKSKILLEKNQVLSQLGAKKPALLVTVGAGDIDTLVKPIKNWIENA